MLNLKDEAIQFLNQVREAPPKYSQVIGYSFQGLPSSKPLCKNEILMKVAQTKSQDMAKRDYFGHVDPDGVGMNFFIDQGGYKLTEKFLKAKKDNNFESIAAGSPTPKQSIVQLLNDGTPDHDKAGHRIHLLGLQKFWSNCTDIGIGFANDPKSKYKNYCCVLVAKHDF